jgi:hypothetical protein
MAAPFYAPITLATATGEDFAYTMKLGPIPEDIAVTISCDGYESTLRAFKTRVLGFRRLWPGRLIVDFGQVTVSKTR